MTTAARWIDYLPLSDLIRAEWNPKLHHPDIGTSLDRFGYVESIAMDERTGRLVAGHGRLDQLVAKHTAGEDPPEGVDVRDDGEWLIPVQRGWSSVDDDEARAYLVASNELTTAGGWDTASLEQGLADMRDRQVDLAGLGLDLATMTGTHTVAEHERKDPEPREPADVQQRVSPGDVWELGPHRLMCGDSRNSEHVARLLDGEQINLAVTSPPYADMRVYDAESGFTPIAPDDYVPWFAPVAANVAEHLAIDGSWFVNIKPGAHELDTHLYVFDLVLAHAREWGWHFATEFCWERGGMPQRVIRRFKNGYEPIYQFVRGDWKIRPDAVRHESDAVPTPLGPGGGNTSWAPSGMMSDGHATQGTPGAPWFSDRTAPGMAYPSNRLPSFQGSHEAVGHGAAFPVGLPAWFIRAYTDEGDRVYDPFMGSGSTLLAADQHQRIGYGMELSPGYCDVILDRWERHGGTTPVLAVDG